MLIPGQQVGLAPADSIWFPDFPPPGRAKVEGVALRLYSG